MINPIFCLPHILIFAGETRQIMFDLKTPDGQAFDTDGYTCLMVVYHFENRSSTPVLIKELTLQEADGGASSAGAVLLTADTLGLSGRFLYQIQIRSETNGMLVPGAGVMDIQRTLATEGYDYGRVFYNRNNGDLSITGGTDYDSGDGELEIT